MPAKVSLPVTWSRIAESEKMIAGVNVGSLSISHQERQLQVAGYLLLPAACLAATACFFFWSALLALACFCEDFFWFDFGDLSPIILFFLRLTHLRHVIFSEGTHILLAGLVIVNSGRKIMTWGANPERSSCGFRLFFARSRAFEEILWPGGKAPVL